MKKIMFNEAYGLTQATIEGRKTNTRRNEFDEVEQAQLNIYAKQGNMPFIENNRVKVCCEGTLLFSKPTRYKVGEVVAVAQKYAEIGSMVAWSKYNTPGWRNKMFVKAELMPYRIRITGIRAERLQDISDADCFKEGVAQVNRECVSKATGVIQMFYPCEYLKECAGQNGWGIFYDTPREAFAALIDKVSCRGTWAANLWVVAYEYELVK